MGRRLSEKVLLNLKAELAPKKSRLSEIVRFQSQLGGKRALKITAL